MPRARCWLLAPLHSRLAPSPEVKALPAFGENEKLRKRVVRDCLIMGAVAGEAAFEEGESSDLEGFGNQDAPAFEKTLHFARAAAFPASECDVRMVGAALGLEADRLADALDLGGKRAGRLFRLHACP